MSDFDSVLETAFRDASGRETFARQVEEKISEIPGAKELLPQRRYGEAVDSSAIKANRTLSALIEINSPQLAVYLGLDASRSQRIQEENEARHLQAEAMRMRTERLRLQNNEVRLRHERMVLSGINPATGRRFGS